MRFPDVESILLNELEQFGAPTLLVNEDIYGADYDISTSPVVLIAAVDGDRDGVFATDNVTIIVVASGRDEARRVSEDIASHLTRGPVANPEGLLDKVKCTTTPRKLPQLVDAYVFYQADFSIESRGF